MMITLVVSICHMIAPISDPVCHEEIVVQDEMSMQECQLSQEALADWKAKSIYRGEQWTIAKYRCISGDYVPKDAI